MKKYVFLSLILLLSLTITACSGRTYVPQNVTTVNYNNYLNGNAVCFTDDALYDVKHIFGMHLYKITAEGQKHLKSINPGDVNFQAYGDTIYYLKDMSEFKDEYALAAYEEEKNKFKNIKVLGDVDITFFLIIDDFVYYYGLNTNREKDLMVYSMKTDEIRSIAEVVETVGVMGDNIVYVKKEKGSYLLYSYDYQNNQSRLLKKLPFEAEGSLFEFNFTEKYVIIFGDYDDKPTDNGERNQKGFIKVYDIEQDKVISNYESNEYMGTFVAFNDYAFFTLTDNNDTSTLNRIKLSDGSCELIKSIPGNLVYVHVTSDEEVYATSVASHDIILYTIDGSETIINPT